MAKEEGKLMTSNEKTCHLALDSSYATWFQHNQGRTITKLYGIEHWAARKSANQFMIPICFGSVLHRILRLYTYQPFLESTSTKRSKVMPSNMQISCQVRKSAEKGGANCQLQGGYQSSLIFFCFCSKSEIFWGNSQAVPIHRPIKFSHTYV